MITGPSEMGTFNQNIEALRGRKDTEAAKIVAKEIESLFAYELIKAMREASQESTKGLGSDVYTSLFDMELARLMADRGLGLKEVLLRGIDKKEAHTLSLSEDGMSKEHLKPQMPEASESKIGTSELGIRDWEFVSRTPGPESQSRFHNTPEDGLPVNGRISSGFGFRIHPFYGDKRFHHGIDIAAPEGSEIYPIRSGKVIFSGEKAGYGNMVIIDHGDGYTTRYAHNKVNLVKTGDYVDSDTVIARVGSTGVSTGPHLHFEVRYKGEPIDPVTLLAMKD